MLVVLVVLATAACGKRSVRRPGGIDAADAAGNGGTPDGESVGGDRGTADGSAYPPCPQPFVAGGSCAVENQVCAPPSECRRCVGGFKLVPLPVSSACVCRAGRWNCLPSPSSAVSDCFVDEPLSCEDARDIYLDPGCVEPAPCTP